MQFGKTLTTVIGAGLIVSSSFLAQSAFAQWQGPGPGGHGDMQRGPGGPGPERGFQGGPGPERGHHGGPGPGRDFHGGPGMHAGGPPAPGPRDWHRGDRLPSSYRDRQYVVDNWRGYGLRRPPRGYHWVGINGDYVLAAVASGVITEIILNSGR